MGAKEEPPSDVQLFESHGGPELLRGHRKEKCLCV